jgi:glucose/arabinose dehydrogenase
MKNFVIGSALLAATMALAAQGTYLDPRPAKAPHQKPALPGQYHAPESKSNVAFDQTTVVSGLESPWALAFLPGGKMLVTEKLPGRLRVVNADGTIVPTPVAGIPKVDGRGQGGLLGLALDPNFATNRLVYWSFSEAQADGTNNTAAARGRFVDDAAAPRMENVQVIFHQEPSLRSNAHFGGRLVFGRDGTLFLTLGERSITEGRMQAQKMDSLLGKIVRLNADGSVPKDNPFVGKQGVRPEIWSFGHRNVQAATLHPTTGELWEIEHGTNGGDELNIARKGKDYGWPTIAYGIEYQGGRITGDEQVKVGMEQPVYYWDPNIAPSGLTFYTGSTFPAWKGNLFVGGLGGTALVRLVVDGEKVVGEERFLQENKERVRDVVQGPDGNLYVLTDPQAGRGGGPAPTGRIIKLTPKK